MAEQPPSSQRQQPSETNVQREESSLDRGEQDLREQRNLKARGSDAAGRVKQTVAKDLQPVLKPLGKARDKIRDNKRWTYPVLAVAGIALAAFLPYLNDYFDVPLWLQRATSTTALFRVALFSLFALGLNIVVGFAGLLDLGYVAFCAIGSYTAAIMSGAHAHT